MTAVREVSWGDALQVEIFRTARYGGLRRAVELIGHEVGAHIGSRNTFAKLFRASSMAELDVVEQFRALLLLLAVGQRPEDWGLGLSVVPRAIDYEGMRERLFDAVRREGIEPPTR